jgi:hypothetical protein
MKKIVINSLIVLFAVWFFQSDVKPQKESAADYQINAFSHLPVMYGGRKKPMDTFARNLLTVLSDKQSARKADGERISAMEWLLDFISQRPETLDCPVFRIENLDLLSTLGLNERKGFRYSYREIYPTLRSLDSVSQAAYKKEDSQRDLYDKQVIKIANKIRLYQNVMSTFEDPSSLPQEKLLATAQRYTVLESYSLPLVIPPGSVSSRWRPLMSALLDNHPSSQSTNGHTVVPDPMAAHFGGMLAAIRDQATSGGVARPGAVH